MTQDEEKKVEECPEGKPADECCGKPEDCTEKAEGAEVPEGEVAPAADPEPSAA